MKTTKITDAEIASMKISSLPSRPTAPTSFGGRGYTASEMKAAFDKLPLYLVERFNALVDDICAEEDSIASEIVTGIRGEHTLATLFADIPSGVFATYLDVLGESLVECITGIKERLACVSELLGANEESVENAILRIDACRREVDAANAAVSALGSKLDNTLERIEDKGLDPENFTIDCGDPLDITQSGGEE